MITPTEAQDLAQTTIEHYIAGCRCANTQDVANVLMKLASMCGMAMAAVVGQSEAVDRMQGTTDHLEKSPTVPEWTRTPLQ